MKFNKTTLSIVYFEGVVSIEIFQTFGKKTYHALPKQEESEIMKSMSKLLNEFKGKMNRLTVRFREDDNLDIQENKTGYIVPYFKTVKAWVNPTEGLKECPTMELYRIFTRSKIWEKVTAAEFPASKEQESTIIDFIEKITGAALDNFEKTKITQRIKQLKTGNPVNGFIEL